MYTHYESEQHIFDKALTGLFLAGKILLTLLLYFPFLFAGYWLATMVLDPQAAAVLWLTAIAGFAYGLFCVLYCLKGILVACRDAGHLLWIPLFLVCTGFTCIAPAWWLFQSIEPVLLRLTPDMGTTFTWLLAISAAIYQYTRYHFLKDEAPLLAWPGYWLGNQLIPTITRLSA